MTRQEGYWYSICQVRILNPGIVLFAIWDSRSRVSFGVTIEQGRDDLSGRWFVTAQPCSPPTSFEQLLEGMRPVVEAAGKGSRVEMICHDEVSYYEIVHAANSQIRTLIPKDEEWKYRLMKDVEYLIKINLRKCIGPKAPLAPHEPIQSHDELIAEWGVPYFEIDRGDSPELGSSPQKTFTLVDQSTKEVPYGFRDIPEGHPLFRNVERVLDGPAHHSELEVGQKMTVLIRTVGRPYTYSIWRTA